MNWYALIFVAVCAILAWALWEAALASYFRKKEEFIDKLVQKGKGSKDAKR